MPTLTYQLEPGLKPDEFIDVLVRSTLAERRPVHDPDVIGQVQALRSHSSASTRESLWLG